MLGETESSTILDSLYDGDVISTYTAPLLEFGTVTSTWSRTSTPSARDAEDVYRFQESGGHRSSAVLSFPGTF